MDKKIIPALAAALMIGAAPMAMAQSGATQPQGTVQVPPTQPGAVEDLQRASPELIDAMPEVETVALDEERVREVLEARGVTDIQDIEREDGFFTARATWYGEDVELRVDGVTGVIVEPRALNENQIAYRLEQEGFTEISEIERNGEIFTATAERDDKRYEITLDAFTGAIVEEREA